MRKSHRSDVDRVDVVVAAWPMKVASLDRREWLGHMMEGLMKPMGGRRLRETAEISFPAAVEVVALVLVSPLMLGEFVGMIAPLVDSPPVYKLHRIRTQLYIYI